MKMPVFSSQNERKLRNGSTHPKCQPKNLDVRVALSDIDQRTSGSAITATPAANVSHVVHFSGFATNKQTPTTNNTAREWRWISARVPASRPTRRGGEEEKGKRGESE